MNTVEQDPDFVRDDGVPVTVARTNPDGTHLSFKYDPVEAAKPRHLCYFHKQWWAGGRYSPETAAQHDDPEKFYKQVPDNVKEPRAPAYRPGWTVEFKWSGLTAILRGRIWQVNYCVRTGKLWYSVHKVQMPDGKFWNCSVDENTIVRRVPKEELNAD